MSHVVGEVRGHAMNGVNPVESVFSGAHYDGLVAQTVLGYGQSAQHVVGMVQISLPGTTIFYCDIHT